MRDFKISCCFTKGSFFAMIKSHQKTLLNRHIFSKKFGGQNASEIKFQGWSVSAKNSAAETESVSQALFKKKQKQAFKSSEDSTPQFGNSDLLAS